MKRFLHIVLLLLVAVSCRGPRVIPREKMMDIYCEMFLTDQLIRNDNDLRRRADTMLVYEAVFNKYGYDTDDYLFTLENNLKDPERFAKLMEEVAERLKAEADLLTEEIDRQEWREKHLGIYHTPVDSLFPWRDSTYLGMVHAVRDTFPPFLFRIVPVEEDTLSVQTDSTDRVLTPDKRDTVPAEHDRLKPTETITPRATLKLDRPDTLAGK